jgi:hypothetical protein
MAAKRRWHLPRKTGASHAYKIAHMILPLPVYKLSRYQTPQLLLRLEQSLVVVLNKIHQYITTSSLWLTLSVTRQESRALSHNLSSLISQIQSVLALLKIYGLYYSSFSGVFLLLSPTDRNLVVSKLLHYSNTL